MTYSTLFMTIVFEKNKNLGRLNAMLEGKKMKKKPKKKTPQ